MEIWIVVRRLCRSILRSSFGSIKLRVVLDAMQKKIELVEKAKMLKKATSEAGQSYVSGLQQG